MVTGFPLLPSLVGVVMGFAAGYAAARFATWIAAATMFVFALGRSRVRPETLRLELSMALIRSLLFAIVCSGAAIAADSMELLKLDSDGFVCFVAAVCGLFAAALQVPVMLGLIRAMAWEPGFAEELSLTPHSKRRLLLQAWRAPAKRTS
ncbi:hypothetical protein SAMN02745126_02145 [Enhydrobacter aerosaccus]|uniref:Uncharacterized protein n=2 Tax=Enhydrobacter aerosaccus TaxID=225324 RepID=A0A1T4N7J3_9HYPH|nr:hypothetical protein SAMN02745126_02145 [Enhydrobacter aerosaccus]